MLFLFSANTDLKMVFLKSKAMRDNHGFFYANFILPAPVLHFLAVAWI